MCFGLKYLKNNVSYVLLNHRFQPLKSTAHVPTFTVAQKLINNAAMM